MHQAIQMLQALGGGLHLKGLAVVYGFAHILSIIGFLLLIEVFKFIKNDQLIILKWHWLLQGMIYFIIIFLIAVGAGGTNEFIYFQF